MWRLGGSLAIDTRALNLSVNMKYIVALLSVLSLCFAFALPAGAQAPISITVLEPEQPRIEPRQERYALVRPSTGEVLCLGDTIEELRTNRWSCYYVRQKDLWGVIAPDGVWNVPCISTQRPDWGRLGDEQEIYWYVYKDGRTGIYGLVPQGGRSEWKEIVPVEMNQIRPWDIGRQFYFWIRTRRYTYDGRGLVLSGLYDSWGREIFPTTYSRIELLGREELLIDDGVRVWSYRVDDVLEGRTASGYAQEYRQLFKQDGMGLWALTMSGVLKMESYKWGTAHRYELTDIDSCQIYHDGLFMVSSRGKQGLMRLRQGELSSLIPPMYDELRPRLNTDRTLVRQGDRWGVVDTLNHSLVPIEYDEPPREYRYDRDVYVLRQGDRELYYNLRDKCFVIPQEE